MYWLSWSPFWKKSLVSVLSELLSKDQLEIRLKESLRKFIKAILRQEPKYLCLHLEEGVHFRYDIVDKFNLTLDTITQHT